MAKFDIEARSQKEAVRKAQDIVDENFSISTGFANHADAGDLEFAGLTYIAKEK